MSTRPRTVGYVTQAPFIGGAERSLLRLAGGVDTTRYRPFVIAGHDGELVRALREARVDHYHMALPHPDRAWPWPFLGSVARLVTQLGRRRTALVHVNDAPAHAAAAIAARILRLPRICHLRFLYPADGLRWYLKWGFERAVFASRFLKDAAQSRCPELFPDERCMVIPNGFDAPPPPSPRHVEGLRVACALAAEQPVVGFVGRLVESKGVADYLTMAQGLLRHGPDTRFVVIGDDQRAQPSHRAEMEGLARRLDIAPACRFLGFRDDVWELLHLCDVVVVPSLVEPFGNVVVEAGAAARPVVATRVGGIPEIVRDGETGLLVPPGDPQALAQAVAALLADPTLRHALGARARTHVASSFGLQEHVRRLTDLYDDLCASV
jgi:glycosyltransferase involved in cell wall biosynthesis